jgi:hypothetical protein
MTSSPVTLSQTGTLSLNAGQAGEIEIASYVVSTGSSVAATYSSSSSLGWGAGICSFKSGVSYRAMIGLVDQDGNIVGISPVSTLTTDANNLLVIQSPQPVPAYMGWVPIVGTILNSVAVQSPVIPFGMNWTEPVTGLLSAAVSSEITESDITNSGSVLFVNLAASTTYFFYPYWYNGQTIRWAGGANPAASNLEAAVMFSDGSAPLASSAGMSATTPVASGGSGGGTKGGCVRKGSIIIPLGQEGIGIEMPQSEWIELRTENGCHLVATPNHPVYTSGSGKTPLEEVQAGDFLVTDKGESKVVNVRSFVEEGVKIRFDMLAGHLFYAGEPDSEALALSHNQKPS